MNGWRLLLTRPAEECAALAAILAGQGIHSASLPLLAIEALDETPEQREVMLELDRYAAVVVVSKPAARLGLERLGRYWKAPPVGPVWFSVGAATGAILEEYGLDVSWPASGSASPPIVVVSCVFPSLWPRVPPGVVHPLPLHTLWSPIGVVQCGIPSLR